MKKSLLTLCILVAVIATSTAQNKATNYKDTLAWYTHIVNGAKADVFYITPTCTWSTADSQGVKSYNMDVYALDQRAKIIPSALLAQKTFADSTNFFCPFYRQVSMDTWLTGDTALVSQRYKVALEDIKNAFKYYMKHINSGRPFILAGHSQGAKCVLDILEKCMTKKEYKKMVGAYVVGFPVTKDYLKGKYVLPAVDSTDCGVVIAFNSVTSIDVKNELMKGNTQCINPVNWTLDSTSAITSDGFSVILDTKAHTLIVSGVDAQKYFVPSVASLLPLGNLHIAEFYLYGTSIAKNVNLRVKHFLEKQSL